MNLMNAEHLKRTCKLCVGNYENGSLQNNDLQLSEVYFGSRQKERNII